MSDFSMRDAKIFAEAWQAAKLPDALITPVLYALGRDEDINRQSRALKDEGEAARKQIGQQIAAGEIALLEGIARHAALTSGQQPLGSATGFTRTYVVLDAATRALRANVVRFLEKNGDALVADTIQPEFDKLRGQVEKLAPKLAASADEATRGGIQGKIADLDRTRDLLVKTYRALRRCGCDVDVPGILVEFPRVVRGINGKAEGVLA